jgi:hypothetical protein
MTSVDSVTLFILFFRSRTVKNNFDELVTYFVAFLVIALSGKFFSDRSFSALLTLSAGVQCLGFALLRLKVHKQAGVQGISSRALQLFAVSYVSRLYSTLQYNGYLPVDRSGDWLYQLIEVVSLLMVISLITTIHTTHRHSYELENDTCGIFLLLAISFLSAYYVHPSLNNMKSPDVAWTAGLYQESLAMVPQLWMLAKKGGEIDGLASHYIACVFFSRVFTLCFWMNSYVELAPHGSEYNIPGWGVLGAQLLQVGIFADFMYYYARAMISKARLVLPTTI